MIPKTNRVREDNWQIEWLAEDMERKLQTKATVSRLLFEAAPFSNIITAQGQVPRIVELIHEIYELPIRLVYKDYKSQILQLNNDAIFGIRQRRRYDSEYPTPLTAEAEAELREEDIREKHRPW